MNDEHEIRVEIRHLGRRYGAAALPTGSTNIELDGVWYCNADWNGRTLYTGTHELHPDLDQSNAIVLALANALRDAGAAVVTRKGQSADRDV